MENNDIESRLEPFASVGKESVLSKSIPAEGMTLANVRDRLLDLGEILEEDVGEQLYLASVPDSAREARRAVVAVALGGDRVDVAACARRGKYASEAIDAFERALHGDIPRRKRRRTLRVAHIAIALVALACCLSVACFLAVVGPAMDATGEYNHAVEEFNEAASAYNEAVADVSVANVKGFVPSAEGLTTQKADPLSVVCSLAGGNSAEKIRADAETVRKMKDELARDAEAAGRVHNPTSDWVSSRLSGVEGIDSVQPVDEGNDPNRMLGKDGGYSSCVYFVTNLFDAGCVSGEGAVAKGVDGGGAVEVFPTLADAQARCDYLSGFDGTVLVSGSYAIVGTMVVRTSCLLGDDSQYELTDAIVKSLVAE